MPAASPSDPSAPNGRCRCGHLPTHHMLVRPVRAGGGYRLVPAGPCSLCGESVCRAYAASPVA